MNLRNYKSQTGFMGEEPWIYPKTKKFKAVVTDKGFFPGLPKIFKNSKQDKGDKQDDGAFSND